jgi:hypothetical protein
MKAMKLVALGVLGAALASCAVWRDRTVERTATDPVPDRSIPRASSSASSFTADYPRDERRANVSEGGAGGSGGSISTR